MADEVEEKPVEEAEKKPEKTYTQAEVDRLIKLQKDKIKPLSDKIEELEKGKDETLTAYEARITAMVDSMSKEIHPSILKLLKKLTPLEQLDYLSDPENNVAFEKPQFPLMPKKAVDGKKEFKPTPIEKVF
jgi:hypothetical protein